MCSLVDFVDFFHKHFENGHRVAYGKQLLQAGCAEVLAGVHPESERVRVLRDGLLPLHAEVFLDYMKGVAAGKAVVRGLSRLCAAYAPFIPPARSSAKRWFDDHLVRTANLCSQLEYDRVAEEDDALLVLIAAETLRPDLFFSDDDLRNSKELETFMRYCVRRGRAFSPEYVAEALGISVSEAKRRSIFDRTEMARLLELSVESVANLEQGLGTPTELAALVRRTRHITRSMRQIREFSEDQVDDYFASATDGRGDHFEPDVLKIAREFEQASAEFSRLSRKRRELRE